jgi:hypothetical protein
MKSDLTSFRMAVFEILHLIAIHHHHHHLTFLNQRGVFRFGLGILFVFMQSRVRASEYVHTCMKKLKTNIPDRSLSGSMLVWTREYHNNRNNNALFWIYNV